MGMGGAVVANPNDLTSAFHYNPAGLALIKGTNLTLGSFYAALRAKYDNPYNKYHRRNSLYPLIPFFGISTEGWRFFVFGLGVYSTLGAGFRFKSYPLGEDSLSRELLNQTGVMFISPTIGYQIMPKLAFGSQLNIGYAQSNMKNITPLGYFRQESKGIGLGATFGLLFKPIPSLSIGASWRSPMRTPLKGDASLNIASENALIRDDIQLTLYWPQMFQFGMEYSWKKKVAVAFSIKWSEWSCLDRAKSRFDSSLIMLNSPLAKSSKDSLRYHFGIEYFLNDFITLRGGYLYDNINIKGIWVSPLLPDQRIHELRLGISIKRKSLTLALGFNYTIFEGRKVSQSLVGYPGRYKGEMFAPGIEIYYKF
jgi:long-chain fatty acid transport protein